MDFSEYVAARRTSLVRSAVLLGCRLPEAEDVVQTTLLKCFRSWARVQQASNPEAYVYTALVNTVRDARQRRWHGEVPTVELPETGAEPDLSRPIAVRRAMAGLSHEHREVLVLRFYADLSEREVCDALGLPPSTVKSRTARAKQALSTLLEAEDAH
ncbi:SigE family RNA polymerase sigma factor [Nocardioides sp. MH1]|uniref:SigE family RNA polymerase sigma factor n=1 Tax=Nocardioides sp. MH1 TaxID=3242490 RepID=UPI00351F85AC